tara:strand:- start:772 stop:1044 length:273 start_codon:yes stop_codon:yes gene_type:complete
MPKTAEDLLAQKMNITPLDFALSELERWHKAINTIAQGQSYQIDSGAGASRKLTRVTPEFALKMYNEWKAKVEAVSPELQVQNRPMFHTV